MTALDLSWPVGEAPPWPGQLVRYGDLELFVRSGGASNPPAAHDRAVLIHGLGGQSTNWTDLMGLLRNQLSMVALDLPGFGWSPPPPNRDYSMAAMTSAAHAVVQQETAKAGGPVHVFGNSLGGAIAIEIAAQFPTLVRSLVLTSPALPDLMPRRFTMGVPLVAIPGVGERVWQRLTQVPLDRQVNAMVDLNYGDPAVVSRTRRAEAAEDYRRRFTLSHAGYALSASSRAILRSYVARGQSNLWRQLAQVRCRALVVYGGRDRLVRATKARRVAAAMPLAEVVLLPRVGHVAQLEAPQLVGGLVATFLDKVSNN